MNNQINQVYSIPTNIPVQNPQIVQTQISPNPQQNVQVINPQTAPTGGQPAFNFPQMNLGIQNNFNDPIDQMLNSMGMPNMGMGMDPGQMFQRMVQHMNQLGMGGPQLGGTSIQGMMNMQGLGNGTMISKKYISKIDYSDGTPKKESYQSQSIRQFGDDGHNISERQEAYKNSATGIQQAALQRLLDDKGTKVIKERNVLTGSQDQHNIYQGISENDLNNFNKQYTDYRDKVHFQENYKFLNSSPNKEGKPNYMLGSQINAPQVNQNFNPMVRQMPAGTTTTTTVTTSSMPQNYTQQIPVQLFGNNVVHQTVPLPAIQPVAQVPTQFVGVNPIPVPINNVVFTQNSSIPSNSPSTPVFATVQKLK